MKVSKERQRLAVVGVLLLWCVALIFVRMHRAADGLSSGLLWNLFLAAVPLFWSAAFQAASTQKRPFWAACSFVLWLLFLPNAPYILTDLIHLQPRPGVPLWYILPMLLSCAGTGTLLGYLSLINVQTIIEQKLGKAMGWIVAASTLMLCGFGIYLGRFLRWNSWDAFTNPLRLFKSIVGQFIDAGPHPNPIAVTLVYGVGLIIGYIAVRVIGSAAHSE